MKKILLSLLALGCFSAANAQTFRFGPTVGGNLNISDETKTKIVKVRASEKNGDETELVYTDSVFDSDIPDALWQAKQK